MYTLSQRRNLVGKQHHYVKTINNRRFLYRYVGCVDGVKTEVLLGSLDDPPVYTSVIHQLTPAQRRKVKKMYQSGFSGRECMEWINKRLQGDMISLQSTYNFVRM